LTLVAQFLHRPHPSQKPFLYAISRITNCLSAESLIQIAWIRSVHGSQCVWPVVSRYIQWNTYDLWTCPCSISVVSFVSGTW
jgi:hypothetical protein